MSPFFAAKTRELTCGGARAWCGASGDVFAVENGPVWGARVAVGGQASAAPTRSSSPPAAPRSSVRERERKKAHWETGHRESKRELKREPTKTGAQREGCREDIEQWREGERGRGRERKRSVGWTLKRRRMVKAHDGHVLHEGTTNRRTLKRRGWCRACKAHDACFTRERRLGRTRVRETTHTADSQEEKEGARPMTATCFTRERTVGRTLKRRRMVQGVYGP